MNEKFHSIARFILSRNREKASVVIAEFDVVLSYQMCYTLIQSSQQKQKMNQIFTPALRGKTVLDAVNRPV